MLFIIAFRHTSVADVVIVFATAPFVTAAIDRLSYGTRADRTTLAAGGAALFGVCIMISGAGIAGRLAGDMLAFGMTVLMAVMMVIVRRHHATPMLPAASASAFFCALLAVPAAAPLAVGPREMMELVLFGVTQFGLGLLLLTLGARLVPATEAALISTLEIPLAALWVWLAFGETPPWTTLMGGVVVVGAIIAQIAYPLVQMEGGRGVA